MWGFDPLCARPILPVIRVPVTLEISFCIFSDISVDFSALEVHFLLQRHMGYFLINFYAPSTLIVVLSWVAFLINREATADRIALGKTSFGNTM